MICPFCKTENRDERPRCYHCEGDLSLLRSVVNRSRHHFNSALEHAERGRTEDALADLRSALELDASFVNAWVVMGTIYAKAERYPEAETAWKKALSLDPRFEKCHQYLQQIDKMSQTLPAFKRLRKITVGLGATVVGLLLILIAIIIPEGLFGGGDWERGDFLALMLLFLPVLIGLLVAAYAKLPGIVRFLSGLIREEN